MEQLFFDWGWVFRPEFLVAGGTSFLLIFAAEMGDKSQLVCMVLAARHRALPVLAGSTAAFAILNALAVIFGVAIAGWIPETVVFGIVALLFLVFGIQALRIQEDVPQECKAPPSSQSIFLTTFMLIFMAEFGDKTQLAVVGLSSTSIPLAVWAGATLALITTSALGIWAGCTLLQRIPISLLHRISGVFFIVLALFAAYQTYQAL
ncbi:Putative Ca2+/H+ antiporter, TMEM165/GDT1 family [Desulfonatronum thiosulfatophilum]|uniref:GDT1 family protein n=1 Tax=Desulfonatronum thiosulfatophilum TaxID=617002 RepID=A0A1G6BZ77_9BACT|nr:TMEM165/GDT1 family protein [Desulfonatronum thiosulfatophilum]SDB25890.1 Putative Ca2+/H+ antiporter, TMEM165/GDT1 family [Desulfonatronum thiosulfatophilum]